MKINRRAVVTSTPAISTSAVSPVSATQIRQQNKTYDTSPIPIQVDTPLHRSPIKMDFPRFSNAEGEDPLVSIEWSEEYMAVHPLTDNEILPTLSSVLREAERRIRDGIQRPGQHIQYFAFQYRELTEIPKMTEKEIMQATLQNCNPQIASMLCSTVTSVGELVQVGTLIEKDLRVAHEYWRRQPESHPKKEKKKPITMTLGMLNIAPAVISISLSFGAVKCQAVCHPGVPAH